MTELTKKLEVVSFSKLFDNLYNDIKLQYKILDTKVLFELQPIIDALGKPINHSYCYADPNTDSGIVLFSINADFDKFRKNQKYIFYRFRNEISSPIKFWKKEENQITFYKPNGTLMTDIEYIISKLNDEKIDAYYSTAIREDKKKFMEIDIIVKMV